MSDEDDDVQVDLPQAKPESEIPAWIREKNESVRGFGFNPKNAHRMMYGSDLSSGAQQALGGETMDGGVIEAQTYEPSEADILAAKDKIEPGLFQWLWDRYKESKNKSIGERYEDNLKEGARQEEMAKGRKPYNYQDIKPKRGGSFFEKAPKPIRQKDVPEP